ncbi:LOW QUALITY PROTEIN: telomerase reverse transcriptase-like [Dreissena polymorpha]|uniref:LOW QUALITY PROTEIN: telomerase reverse transcriptase-like n=1 Tax=Dreissena polymorpha TaxID=45954 RepID=UPI002263FD67|nr:LOW QUALITY PROTEIN: telomerase reverse transcriptase-like [Dreissena polymorpha]
MSLGQLMSGIKTKNVQWLLSVECNRCRLDLMSRLVHWIITQFVFVLLRTHFYITDTTFLRYRLVYYRQATWTRLHIQGLTGLLHRKIMSPVSEMFVRNLVSSRAGLGISTLRFLPKQKSLRPIVNMGCPARILSTQPYLSVNQQLKDLHKVLTHLKDRTPRLVGSGKLGMNDIHASWAQYMAIWRQGGARKLYFVKTDISNCYDSIIQEKLVQIMESIIKEELQEECVVRKYFTFTLQGGQVRKTYQRHAAQLSNFIQDFTNFAKSQVIEKNLHGVVFVDKVLYQHLSTETVLQILRSHIFNNIVKVGRQYYLQNEGISQGSILSTLLCNFYYACMEHDHIALQSDELLMRVVDDYHFVSPSLERATGFLRTMLAGIKDYNCHTNVDKVMSNFSCSVVENQSIEYIETGWFPWCGLLFNMQTLEVAMDYTRYAGASIKDTMTFDFVREPGKTFKRKLIGSLRQKCHDMFLDPAVNSPSQIFTSVYHLFLLTMLKFHACARSLPVKQRVEDNPGFFYGVLKSVSYSMMRILQKQQKACAENLNQSQLNASITWLCWKAFLVTYRLRLCFPRLTKLVKAGVVAVKKHLRQSDLIFLESIAGDDLPSVFENIMV